MIVGVDEMAETVESGVGECVSVACRAVFVCALENAHFIGEIAAVKGQHTADSRGEVRLVRLKLSCFKSLLKGFAAFDEIIDSVGLVAVGDDEPVARLPDGGIDDKRGILNL